MAKTILIIDDSASMRQAVETALSEAGYRVETAGDGQAALDLLDGRKFHLIICDVNMPVMNGIEFLKAYKQLPAYKFTPVIMLTTESSEEMKQEGLIAGAKAWVVKPFEPPVLINAVARLVLP